MTNQRPDSGKDPEPILEPNPAIEKLIELIRSTFLKIPGDEEAYDVSDYPEGVTALVRYLIAIVDASLNLPREEQITVYREGQELHILVWKTNIDLKLEGFTLTIFNNNEA